MGGAQDDNAILMPFRGWIAAHRDDSAASDPAVEEASSS
jgi:hypothetical protein